MRRAQSVRSWNILSKPDNTTINVGLPVIGYRQEDELAKALEFHRVEDIYVIAHVLVTLYHLDLYGQ